MRGRLRLHGDRLRKARDLQGFTQQEMAEHVGVSVSLYSRWERNKLVKMPSADHVLLACTKLKVGVRYVMGLRDEARMPEHVTDDEFDVLTAYRALETPEAKASARRRLQALRDGYGIGDVVPFRRPRSES